MSSYFYNNIPEYHMSGFIAVRNSLDNLYNVLKVIEILNTCQYCAVEDATLGFNIALFTGDFKRVVIKKDDGFFSMAIPFQVIIEEEQISFNCDELSKPVDGRLISIIRNIIKTAQDNVFSNDDIVLSLSENFNLSVAEAISYCDAFVSLISEDHGYFRFDDDPVNQNGNIHPRYHFDIFYKNTSSIKIGYHRPAQLDCFYSLIDSSKEKMFLQ